MLKVLDRVEKSIRSEQRRIDALLVREEAVVRRAFRRYLDELRSEPVLRQVRLALQNEGIEGALRIADAHVVRLGSVIPRVFQDVGGSEASALADQLGAGAARVALSFDPTFARAAEIMRRNRLQFVREFTGSQREATRAALTESLQAGDGPIKVARVFRDSIGLTERQRQAVGNYRSLLERGDAEALERGLRDRRFDSTVRRAVDTGEPLGGTRIQRMVEQYRNRYLQFRAETIARTETLRVANEARGEALQQTLDQAGLKPGSVRRTWRATLDLRTRDTHTIMNGQERGLQEAFVSPSGAHLMFPGDPQAPPSETINCRCVVVNRITS